MALSSTPVTLISVCDGCALFLGGIAFGAHVARLSGELMPSSLRGHDVFVHSGSPFSWPDHQPAAPRSQCWSSYLQGLFWPSLWSGDGDSRLDAPERAPRSGCLSECAGPSHILRMWPSQRRLRCLRREYMLGRPARGSRSAFVTWSCQVMPRILRRFLR